MKINLEGWGADARIGLERLIKQQAGKGEIAVFDFDNTLICGDIGEAVLAVLVRDKAIQPVESLCPSFRLNAKVVSARHTPDLIGYYEALLNPTVHGSKDKAPLSNAYAWAVQIMSGLTLRQIMEATQRAFSLSRQALLAPIEISPGVAPFPAPSFYPQAARLIASLLSSGWGVWIVSASNVWSVRWMVKFALNPQLESLGASGGIPSNQVLGLSVLLADSNGQLHKDTVLLKTRSDYRELKHHAMDDFKLTPLLEFPVPAYSGKVARIMDQIGRTPLLAAGDSPGDLPMLSYSRNRLWIRRRNKPAFQTAMRAARRETGSGGWFVQSAAQGKFIA